MEREISRYVSIASRIVTLRFPFWEAFSTAMLIGEWDSTNRCHGIPNILIYIHIAVAVLLGVIMGFDEQRSLRATLYAALQMVFLTIASYVIWSYRPDCPDDSDQVAQSSSSWFGSDDSDSSDSSDDSDQMLGMVRAKIFSRNVGILGAYLLFSSGSVNRRSVQLGNVSISVSLASQAYLLFAWPQERSRIFTMLPLASAVNPFTFLLCVMFCICAFCFTTQMRTKTAARCALAGWSLMFLVNLHFGYWSLYMELWTQLRIIAADICIMLTLATTYAAFQLE